jgi:hypothetical protein
VSCYSDIIKIRAVCGDTSDSHSGYYLEDLPGFDQSLLDAVLSTSDISSTLLGERLIELAWRAVEQDALTLLSPKLKVGSILRSGVIGQYEQKTLLPTAGRTYGIVVELWRDVDLALLIQNIKLLLYSNATPEVKVYDLTTGETLRTFSVTAVANQTLVTESFLSLEGSSQRKTYFIGFEPTVNSYWTPVNEGGCCGSGLKAYAAYIPTASAKLLDNVKRSASSPGISLDYSIRCEYHSFLCRNALSFAQAALYRVGVALMDEILYNRINVSHITGIDRDKATEQKAQHFADYSAIMKGVSQGMTVPDNQCFQCNQRSFTRVDL